MGQRILVPVDDSKHAKEGFDYALDQFPDAEVTVLHVLSSGSGDIASMGPGPAPSGAESDESEPETPLGDLSSFGSVGSPEATDWSEMTDEEKGQALLDQFVEYAADRDVEIDSELARGRPDRAIVKFAEDGEYDLVVLGSHGRQGVARVLLGSVAEKVVRRSPAPVLVVR